MRSAVNALAPAARARSNAGMDVPPPTSQPSPRHKPEPRPSAAEANQVEVVRRQGERTLFVTLHEQVEGVGPCEGGVHARVRAADRIAVREQTLDAQKADIRADIYSLGCTLYYLLAGNPPFKGTSLFDLIQSHHNVLAKPLSAVRPDVPMASGGGIDL